MLFPKLGKYIIIFFAIAFIIAGIRGYQLYMYVFRENAKTDYVLIIPEDADYADVYKQLESDEVLENYKAFRWVSKKKNYPENIKPGRYRIERGMNTNQIVNKLIGGLQDPVGAAFDAQGG